MSQSIYAKLGICPARLGTFCSCGRCRAIIARYAAKEGLHPAAFLDNLGLTPARRPSTKKSNTNLQFGGRVAERLVISNRGGGQVTGPDAIVKVLTVLGGEAYPRRKKRG